MKPRICIYCGKQLAPQSTGRPRRYCEECLKKHRRKRQHDYYLHRKYSDKIKKTQLDKERTEKKLRELELEDDKLRDQKAIQRHKRWWKHYLKQRPGLYMIDPSCTLSFEEKEKRLKSTRRRLKEELARYSKTNRYARQGLYNEPLWRPARKKKRKTS